MATKKSKSSNKSNKDKSTKPAADKSATKVAEKATEKAELEAPKNSKEDNNHKEKRDKQKDSKATKSHWYSGFFAKKYEEKEGILTVFKTPKFYGALLGEIIGTLLLALLLFSLLLLGIPNIATYAFTIIALLIAIYAFSGACLNPFIAVGMMATRRISVIRGVMYIVAEVVGAWLGWLIFSGFKLAGGETAYEMPAISEIGEGAFWNVASVELLCAIIIAFFFARALKYKRSVFTFGAVVTGGIICAILVGYVVSAAFLGLDKNFIFNPAVAAMLNIIPQSGANFGEIIGGIAQALSAYAILPMIGGVVGFYLADFTSKLSGEE